MEQIYSRAQKQALAMLSIAEKAGKVQSGGFQAEKAIQENRAYLVMIAGDASANTCKKFTDKCRYYQIPCVVAFDSTVIGKQIGKQERTVLAVTDQGLAKQISDRLD